MQASREQEIRERLALQNHERFPLARYFCMEDREVEYLFSLLDTARQTIAEQEERIERLERALEYLEVPHS